jgi:GNAT superfamily N-acetyltransferase
LVKTVAFEAAVAGSRPERASIPPKYSMRNWITLTEDLFSMNTPDEQPAESHEYKGLRFEKQTHGWHAGSVWFVFLGDTPIAAFAMDERAYNAISLHTEVDEPYQRKGYGRIIYEFAKSWGAEQKKKLHPSFLQSPQGKAFWKKNADLFGDS